MEKALIIHGKPSEKEYYSLNRSSDSNNHWIPWLQHQLLLKDVLTQTPEMPRPYEPDYESWKKVFEQFVVDESTLLVGHSCGAGFLVRYLSEEKRIEAGKVILVAPWLGDKESGEGRQFFDFEIDPQLNERVRQLVVFNSSDDDEGIHKSVEEIRQVIKDLKYREFKDHGHFCLKDLKSERFPALLEEALS